MNQTKLRSGNRGIGASATTRVLRVAQGIFLFLAFLTFSSSSAQARLIGDLNDDGLLDAADALILKALLRDPSAAIPGSDLFRAADVAPIDGNGPNPNAIVDAGDLVVLIRSLVVADLIAMPVPTLDAGPIPTDYLVTITGTTLPGATVTLFAQDSAYYFQDTGGVVATTGADENGVFSFEGVVVANAGKNNFYEPKNVSDDRCEISIPYCV